MAEGRPKHTEEQTHFVRETEIVKQERIPLAIVCHDASSRRLPMRREYDDRFGFVLFHDGRAEVFEKPGEAAIGALNFVEGTTACTRKMRRVDKHWPEEV